MTEETSAERTVLVMNPKSGTGDHVEDVRRRASVLGYDVRTTEREGHGVELAREAAREGAGRVVAVGGDGTINEVVRGLLAADALDRVTLGVVPAGTGNDFATNVGIGGIDEAFDLLENATPRRLDLGMADGHPFLNSCVAGLTAAASRDTDPEMKSRYGILAYAITALREAADFQGLELRLSRSAGSDADWEGRAAVVLVGNGRRFSTAGSEQANLEDGLLEVTIIEDASSIGLLEDRVVERLLDEEGTHVTRMLASSLTVSIEDSEPATFSLDGEMVERESVTLQTRHRALEMPVGERYDPDPD